MKHFVRGSAAVALLTLANISSALAHAGHDHSHWSSSLLHTFFYLSMIAAGSVCLYAGFKALHRKKSAQ